MAIPKDFTIMVPVWNHGQERELQGNPRWLCRKEYGVPKKVRGGSSNLKPKWTVRVHEPRYAVLTTKSPSQWLKFETTQVTCSFSIQFFSLPLFLILMGCSFPMQYFVADFLLRSFGSFAPSLVHFFPFPISSPPLRVVRFSPPRFFLQFSFPKWISWFFLFCQYPKRVLQTHVFCVFLISASLIYVHYYKFFVCPLSCSMASVHFSPITFLPLSVHFSSMIIFMFFPILQVFCLYSFSRSIPCVHLFLSTKMVHSPELHLSPVCFFFGVHIFTGVYSSGSCLYCFPRKIDGR